jgi:carbamoyltransferase
MLVLGLDLACHDGGACIVQNGRVLCAVSEERLNRSKHSRGWQRAAGYVLEETGASSDDLDAIAFSHPYLMTQSAERFLPILKIGDRVFHYGQDLLFVPHYVCHASSSFLSDFDEALVYVIDGHGSSGREMVTQGAYLLQGTRLQPIYLRPNALKYVDVGLTYESFAYHLGFENEEFDAGKVMGLSAYGDRSREFGEPLFGISKGHIAANPAYIEYSDVIRNTTRALRNLPPRRTPQEDLLQEHMDIAAFLQRESERIVTQKVRQLLETTGPRPLCLAGGVALNGLINRSLVRGTPCRGIYVPAMPNDAGTAVGAALKACADLTGGRERCPAALPFWGKTYSRTEIDGAVATVSDASVKCQYRDSAQLHAAVCECLAQGLVVGWFQGGAEFGPRALGNRSILCCPGRADARHRVNSRVKHREWFRPFAPVVPASACAEYFDLEVPSPFMSFICIAKPRTAREAPAIVHVDGTARVQTLEAEQNRQLHSLLLTYAERTGRPPILLNTSFNIAGEPLVETPGDAVATYMSCGMDALAVGGWLMKKRTA